MTDQAVALPAPDVMKRVNRQFVTGVTVVTTVADRVPRGLAVNAFMSLSLEPPMVLFAVQHNSGTHPLLYSRDHVAINILSAANSDVVKAFASKGADKFAGVQWRPGPFGSPLIDRASAHIEVIVRERIQASTHTLFVARVMHAESFDEPPLVYFDGQFASSTNLLSPVETS
jgi:flavin reductase (DIM6/NTAB) family NADH-FMN oxidoreductase RutF